MSKLNPTKVKEIKADLTEGLLKQPEIAKKHKISRSTISDIATGRIWTSVPWPNGDRPLPKRSGGQRNKLPDHDPTDKRILELEAEIVHLTDERNRERSKVKASAKTQGLFKCIVDEMDKRIEPLIVLPKAKIIRTRDAEIEEHVVMHVSDGHHDQVVTLEDSMGLEEYNFPISCVRAERYVDTVIDWCIGTLDNFNFKVLWIPMYGDNTSGEIHGHGPRSYYRNQFKNCLAIGQLHSLMIRDLAPYFDQINVIYLPGNHGRRSKDKDYYGPQNNFDYLIGEIARLHCRNLGNVSFLIPNSYAINVDINGVGFNFSHGDDVRSNGGVPFFGMLKRQNGLVALGSITGFRTRYSVMGHHHTLSSLSTIGDSELIVNGAWPATDPYTINALTGYREPAQLLHGVNPKYGITWRMNVKLKDEDEKAGPKRYKIDGGRDVGPLLVSA